MRKGSNPKFPNSGSQVKRGRISRVGVQPYLERINPDGSPKYRWEYRPADEVFAADSITSFENAALTWDHPSEDVTPDNFGNYGCGFVRDVARDGDRHVGGSIVFSRRDAFDAYEGGIRELSAGYYRDWDWTPGDFEGIAYDCIQRNIRGNHVALVLKGRAGDSVRVLDRADMPVLALDAIAPILPKAFVTWGDRGYGTVVRVNDSEVEIEEEDGRLVIRRLGEVELARPPGERDMPAVFRCPACGYETQEEEEEPETNQEEEDDDMTTTNDADKTALDAANVTIETLRAQNAALQQQLTDFQATAKDSASNATAKAVAAIQLREDVQLVVDSLSDKADDAALKLVKDASIADYCSAVPDIQKAVLKIVAPTYTADGLDDVALGHVYEAVMSNRRQQAKEAKAQTPARANDTGIYTPAGYRELSKVTPGAQGGNQLVAMLRKLETGEEAAFGQLPKVTVTPSVAGHIPQAAM